MEGLLLFSSSVLPIINLIMIGTIILVFKEKDSSQNSLNKSMIREIDGNKKTIKSIVNKLELFQNYIAAPYTPVDDAVEIRIKTNLLKKIKTLESHQQTELSDITNTDTSIAFIQGKLSAYSDVLILLNTDL